MVSFFSSQNTSRKNQERGSRLGETHSYPDRRGVLRSLIESFISLFIAVLLFRTFAAEGYMISTGSMAPCLLGFHKRVECPTCATTFSFGVAYDTDEEGQDIELARGRTRAICPNCGQRGIDVSLIFIAHHSGGKSSFFEIRRRPQKLMSNALSECLASRCNCLREIS